MIAVTLLSRLFKTLATLFINFAQALFTFHFRSIAPSTDHEQDFFREHFHSRSLKFFRAHFYFFLSLTFTQAHGNTFLIKVVALLKNQPFTFKINLRQPHSLPLKITL